MSLRGYFSTTRQPRYAVVFAIPLLFLYEGLAAILSHSAMAGVRNGADVLLKTVFVTVGGRWGIFAFGLLLLGAGGWLALRDQRSRGVKFEPRLLGGMFVESLIYAVLFGRTAALLTTWLLEGGPSLAAVQGPMEALPLGTQLVVSLGAGLYEELLFRVLLVSGLILLFVRLGWRRPVAVGVAVVLSALIFSGFHYVGPYGDQLVLSSFTFRAIAGLLFSGLYVARGFGIAAWTHALYDVGLAVL